MIINTNKKGIVIGKKGYNINNIKRNCGGIQIIFEDLVDNKTKIRFMGEQWQIKRALESINQLFKKYETTTRKMIEPDNYNISIGELISIAKRHRVRIEKQNKQIIIKGTDTDIRLCECNINKLFRENKEERKRKKIKKTNKISFDCLYDEMDTIEFQEKQFPTLSTDKSSKSTSADKSSKSTSADKSSNKSSKSTSTYKETNSKRKHVKINVYTGQIIKNAKSPTKSPIKKSTNFDDFIKQQLDQNRIEEENKKKKEAFQEKKYGNGFYNKWSSVRPSMNSSKPVKSVVVKPVLVIQTPQISWKEKVEIWNTVEVEKEKDEGVWNNGSIDWAENEWNENENENDPNFDDEDEDEVLDKWDT
jgi:hypothetical protein